MAEKHGGHSPGVEGETEITDSGEQNRDFQTGQLFKILLKISLCLFNTLRDPPAWAWTSLYTQCHQQQNLSPLAPIGTQTRGFPE